MKKIYKNLTEEQKNREVIFSSCLSEYTTEQKEDNIHEILKTDEDKQEVEEKLKNDKFFNNSHYKYNIIRR